MSTRKYKVNIDGTTYSTSVTSTDGTNFTVVVGSDTFSCTIEESLITSHILGLSSTTEEYTGSEIKPSVLTDGTVTLNKDYSVTYSDNTAVGTATVTVTGMGDYSGSKAYQFTITQGQIASHVTGLEQTSYVYTGEEIKPAVINDGTVVLDTDYTVEYSNNKEVGTAKATAIGKGNFTGTREFEFEITAAEANINSDSSDEEEEDATPVVNSVEPEEIDDVEEETSEETEDTTDDSTDEESPEDDSEESVEETNE